MIAARTRVGLVPTKRTKAQIASAEPSIQRRERSRRSRRPISAQSPAIRATFQPLSAMTWEVLVVEKAARVASGSNRASPRRTPVTSAPSAPGTWRRSASSSAASLTSAPGRRVVAPAGVADAAAIALELPLQPLARQRVPEPDQRDRLGGAVIAVDLDLVAPADLGRERQIDAQARLAALPGVRDAHRLDRDDRRVGRGTAHRPVEHLAPDRRDRARRQIGRRVADQRRAPRAQRHGRQEEGRREERAPPLRQQQRQRQQGQRDPAGRRLPGAEVAPEAERDPRQPGTAEPDQTHAAPPVVVRRIPVA